MFPRPRFLQALGLSLACLVASGCASLSSTSKDIAAHGVHLYETNNVIRVDLDGQLFTQYHFKDVSRPFLYPLLSADGEHLTRRWPQEDVPGEEHDHPHHHALWYSHGDVNGVDLWSESPKAGRTVQQAVISRKSGANTGELTTRNEWRDKDGKVIAHDTRTHRFHRPTGPERIIDFEITIEATAGEVTLGDTKEGTFAIRMAESMRNKQPKNQPGLGHLTSSRGHKDGEVWGKRAEWVDYTGPVNGKTYGIAIFDHPQNPRYPTWWHARDYGLFAANPFGVHDFEKSAKGTGDLKIPAGGSITFRYRVLLHPGDTASAGIAARFDDFVRAIKVKP